MKGIDDFLDGYSPTTAFVFAPVDDAVGAFAQFLEDLVFLVDLVVQLLRLFHSENIIGDIFFENGSRGRWGKTFQGGIEQRKGRMESRSEGLCWFFS